MLSILFVDDEAHLLQGIRRLLHSHRQEWAMTFCNSGEEAMRQMAKEHFDIVVTDMRMPEVDGSRVLFESYLNCPSTMRCVLSGQAERAQTCKVSGTAHQFLSKPTQQMELEEMVARVERLNKLPLGEELRLAATRLAAVPCQPHILALLSAELTRPDPQMDAIAKLVSRDVGMSAKVVQLVWSSFFGLPRKSLCPIEAVNLLGVDMLRELAIEHGLFTPFVDTPGVNFSISELCEHSVQVARTAQAIAMCETNDKAQAKLAYFAGLMHDIGKLILVHQFPDRYAAALRKSREEDCTLWQAECEIFGASHADVGSYLLALWGFPDEVIQSVAHYRSPSQCDANAMGTATAVHVANLLKRNDHSTRNAQQQQLLYGSEHLAASGLAGRISAWCAAIQGAEVSGLSFS